MISADGHPVRGAFTFAVGPNPGPAPQFVIPSISETAATPRLLVARWIAFLSVMAAIGLFVLRMGDRAAARPARRRDAAARGVDRVRRRVRDRARRDAGLRVPRDGAVRAALGVGRRRARAADARVVVRARLRRPRAHVRAVRARRRSSRCGSTGPSASTARSRSCSRFGGALLAAGAVLLVPGHRGARGADVAARRGRSSSTGRTSSAGSVWVGGLIGLLVLWSSLPAARRIAGLVVSVPRFSNVAFVSVNVLIASRRRRGDHPPADGRRRCGRRRTARRSSEGRLLLGGAMLSPRSTCSGRGRGCRRRQATVPTSGPSTATLLRRLVGSEVVLVAAIVFAAAVLSSLPPPAKALGKLGVGGRARRARARCRQTVERNGYTLRLDVTPNRAAQPNTFAVVDHARRQARHRRRRDDDVRDARHGDGPAGVRVQGDVAGRVQRTPRRRS